MSSLFAICAEADTASHAFDNMVVSAMLMPTVRAAAINSGTAGAISKESSLSTRVLSDS